MMYGSIISIQDKLLCMNTGFGTCYTKSQHTSLCKQEMTLVPSHVSQNATSELTVTADVIFKCVWSYFK